MDTYHKKMLDCFFLLAQFPKKKIRTLRIWPFTHHSFMHVAFLCLYTFPIFCHGYEVCKEDLFKQKHPSLRRYLDLDYLLLFDEILVIGDVHGCYDELLALLEKANAGGNNVLKIFVGDLVRKGPKNIEVLNLVRTSWSMLSVRGNNDQIVLQELCKAKNPTYEIPQEDAWIKDLSSENVEYLSQLPHTITLLPLNTVIVHAGIVPDTLPENNSPYYLMNIIGMVYDEQRGCLYPTNNKTAGTPWSTLWRGPPYVVFGHDSRKMLQLRELATGIDTGCVFGHYLTGLFIYGPRAFSLYQTKALKTYDVQKEV